MNYEERYKEALERAKKVHDGELTILPNEVNDFNVYEYIFPELKESEDEKIRKEIIELVHFFYGSSTIYEHHVPEDDMIAWLEKQGEHANFRNKIQVGDEVTKNEDGVLVNLSQLKRVAKPSEKSANKNKPKFKVGDWITNGEYTWKVIDIKPLDYLLQAQNGDVVGDTISYVDEEYHLWTIQDAKDGDVLAEHETIVLFKKIEGQNIRCYCTYHYLGFNTTFYVGTFQNKNPYCPATKEQRALLFQKMREAGYVWYAEKKELKKIEQKSSWSEEDEEMIDFMIEFIESLYWRKDLTKRKDEVLSWLKSIKPQKRWKPSEEQMEAIKFCCANFEEYDALKSLYNDLKGLNLC